MNRRAPTIAATLLFSSLLSSVPAGSPGANRPPHMDHSPKHGGVFFMAPNGRNHLEGVLLAPGIVKLYLYDEFTRPLDAKSLVAELQLRDVPDAAPFALRPAADGTLCATLPAFSFPLALDAWITFPRSKRSPESRDLFSFEFDRFSDREP